MKHRRKREVSMDIYKKTQFDVEYPDGWTGHDLQDCTLMDLCYYAQTSDAIIATANGRTFYVYNDGSYRELAAIR